MSTIYWIGRAKPVAQITLIEMTGPVVAAESWGVTINGKTIAVLATGTDLGDLIDALVTALNASTIPEFAELTWSNQADTYLVATADTAGVPHTITPVTDSAAGTMVVDGGSTAATGPNHWDNTANWQGGAVPVTGDSIVLANSNQGILYGWPGSAAVLVDCNVLPTFTGAGVGLPTANALGYREYRPQFPTNVTITTGTINASGCTRFNITGLAASAAITITGGTINLQGSLSDSQIDVASGATLNIGGPDMSAAAATVRIAKNAAMTLHKDATITTLRAEGTCVVDGTITSMYVIGGTMKSAKNPATTDIAGGTTNLNGSETITTLKVGPGTLDLGGDLSTFSVTNLHLRPGHNIRNINDRISNTPAVTITAKRFRD